MSSNFPHGFLNGVTIRGLPLLQTHTGKIFHVSNSTAVLDTAVAGSNTQGNGTFNNPLATIDYAVGLCKAGRGDIILVHPGHVETITGTDITLDVQGVAVVGLGHGSLQPRIKHNHADAEVSVAASDISWLNIRHSADVTAVKVAIEIEDASNNCFVKDCKFDVVTTTTDEFLVSVRTNDASNNAVIDNCDFDMGLGGAVAAISFTKDTDSTKVTNNLVQGDFSTACINGITTLSTKLLIKGNILINGGSNALGTEPAIELVTLSTGIVANNFIVCNLATKVASVVADKVMLFENYYNEDVNPGTGGLIGTASADD